jgi:hypothetical protein
LAVARDDHQADYRVSDLFLVAKAPRFTYYAPDRARRPSPREVANEELLAEIRVIHERSRRTYGAPRVWGQLRHRGHRVGRHFGARLMAENAVTGVHRRKKWRRGSANRA